MAILGKDLIQLMDVYAPPAYAIAKDKIGLQLGSSGAEVKGVLVTLDITEEVVNEAIKNETNWIVAHHALIYQPLVNIQTDTPAGRIMSKLIKNDINVFIAHTNLDATDDGVNDVLANRINLINKKTFLVHKDETFKKLVVFVPKDHQSQILEAVSAAGAGWIGNYSHCSYNIEGFGTFKPEQGSNPYIGTQNKLERVEEIRLETVFALQQQEEVIKAMLAAHPYEEVAYDIYPLDLPLKRIGFGKIGALKHTCTLEKLAQDIKTKFKLKALRVVGNLQSDVSNIAILGGSGGKYIRDAIKQNVDVYITGDIDFHSAQEAQAHGLSLIDPGHHIEYYVVEMVCQKLKKLKIPVYASLIDTNPFLFV